MNIVGRQDLFSVAYQTDVNPNAAAQSFPTPTLTPPATGNPDGYVSLLAPDGLNTVSGLKIMPFGIGNTNTLTMVVVGWTCTTGNLLTSPNKLPLWVPIPLVVMTGTLTNNFPGVSGADVDASHFFAGTLAITVGNSNYSSEVITSSSTYPGVLMVLTKDCFFAQIIFTAGTATAANALVARV